MWYREASRRLRDGEVGEKARLFFPIANNPGAHQEVKAHGIRVSSYLRGAYDGEDRYLTFYTDIDVAAAHNPMSSLVECEIPKSLLSQYARRREVHRNRSGNRSSGFQAASAHEVVYSDHIEIPFDIPASDIRAIHASIHELAHTNGHREADGMFTPQALKRYTVNARLITELKTVAQGLEGYVCSLSGTVPPTPMQQAAERGTYGAYTTASDRYKAAVPDIQRQHFEQWHERLFTARPIVRQIAMSAASGVASSKAKHYAQIIDRNLQTAQNNLEIVLNEGRLHQRSSEPCIREAVNALTMAYSAMQDNANYLLESNDPAWKDTPNSEDGYRRHYQEPGADIIDIANQMKETEAQQKWQKRDGLLESLGLPRV